MITLENAQSLLENDDLIQLSFIYSYRSHKYWKLLKPMVVKLSNGKVIRIPEGFVTDLSSSPKYLWSLARPFGDFLLAALIHDYLYIHKTFSRSFADKEMLIWSKAINDNRFDNVIRYIAVRLFGWTWWFKLIKNK